MDTANFKILSASAGTGKTYRLTKTYLLVLLGNNSPQNFRNLLAITFTNKAVAEMKQRILYNLVSFASNDPDAKNKLLFQEITNELEISSLELVNRSKKTLKNLLHNYAFFDVSTIDAFNYRLIKTFAKDLNIAQNFEVELDTESVLSRAINNLLEKAGADDMLTSILVDFALEKIDKGKSWNIAYDLNQTGKLIFHETHYQHLKSVSKKPLGDYLKLKKTIAAQTDNLILKIQKEAQVSLDLIAENGLEFSDFTRSYLPKFLEQAIARPLKIDFSAKWKQNFEETQLYNKSLDSIKKETIDRIYPKLNANFTLLKNTFNRASLLIRFEKNIIPLALITSIKKEIDTLKHDKSFLTINEFNELISQEIKQQPIPYIYERLGERYRHYFIDEFQDTSVLQWENLIPLIAHALESSNEFGQKGSLFLVGDVKQSIYRWRGGDPMQFMQLIYGANNPFTISAQVEQLPKNWRSYDEIVNFNNHFFSYISNKIENREHQRLYTEGNQQEANGKKGGVVRVSFLPNTGVEVYPHCEKALSSIEEITSLGHSYGDICILVRNKNNEKLLAEYLTEKKVPVISAEGLLLQNNEDIKFVISFLEFVLNPSEKEYTFSVLNFLFRDSKNLHNNILTNWDNPSAFLMEKYGIDVAKLKFKDPLSLIETLVYKIGLVSESNAYLITFLDTVADYEKTNRGGIHGFLEYWHLNKSKLVLPMPENINAVKIMTIHKSKGLEFPFVIFPFADDVINAGNKQNDIWIPVNPENYVGFNELMVTNNELLNFYSSDAAEAYKSENEKKVLDDFNVLYVALTRAIKGLFIISTPAKENTSYVSYATLFGEYLESQNLSVDDSGEIVIGELTASTDLSEANEQELVPFLSTSSSIDDFQIAHHQIKINSEVREGVKFGNLMHSLLAEVFFEEHIPASIEKHVRLGLLERSEVDRFRNLLQKIVRNENLKRFFAKNIDSKNESEILIDDGSTIRPDRLVFREGKVSIIDYKTGRPSENHKVQIEQYANALIQMGYEVEEKILAYIEDEFNILSV